jgi:peptidoglycan/xylan/chitin deacetylase (PgdA/CDA1 family)
MLRIALTHDIDRTRKTYQFITKPLMALKKLNLNHLMATLKTMLHNGNYWNFEDIISIENKYNVKSTFFFLNENIPFEFRNPRTFKLAIGRYNIEDPEIVDLIKWLDTNGWEIGVHGSYRSYNDLNLLSYEKKTLERIVGHKIVGIRQHYLNMDDSTWAIQRKLGFKYDSSFGFTREVGFKDNEVSPFRPFDDDFMVIPQTLMDTPYMMTSDKEKKLEHIFDQCEEKNGILVVNFHNDKFNIHDFPGYRDAYIGIIEAGKSRGAIFDTMSGFYKNIYLGPMADSEDQDQA